MMRQSGSGACTLRNEAPCIAVHPAGTTNFALGVVVGVSVAEACADAPDTAFCATLYEAIETMETSKKLARSMKFYSELPWQKLAGIRPASPTALPIQSTPSLFEPMVPFTVANSPSM